MAAALQLVRIGLRSALRGSWAYYLWLAFLLAWMALGGAAYAHQLRHGLVVTHLTDQVTWGAYVGHFTFLVGTAASAVVLLVPRLLGREEALGEAAVWAQLMAIAALVMSVLFLVVDLGRPERLWHMLPGLGRLHWPESLLGWDLLALSGYLALCIALGGGLLWARARGRPSHPRLMHFLAALTVAWAVGLRTVTAFLYEGLGARHYWNAAVLAPHFLASAVAGGMALLIVLLLLLRALTPVSVGDVAIRRLGQIAAVAMLLNLFLFAIEVFPALYTGAAEAPAMHYHLFGLPGHRLHAVSTWSAVVLNVVAVVAWLSPRVYRRPALLAAASVGAAVGIWIEKGMGILEPGFVPTPLGEVVPYLPSWVELGICAGIAAFGALLYTLMVKAAVPLFLTPRDSQRSP